MFTNSATIILLFFQGVSKSSTMTTIGTPLHVSILLHCHTSASRFPNYEATAVQEYLNNLLDEGAIYWHIGDPPGYFRTTEKGRAWVAAICATPPPVQCWKDSNGKVINVMNTPDTQKPVMSLEETEKYLEMLKKHHEFRVSIQKERQAASTDEEDVIWWAEQARLEQAHIVDALDAAIHHLEAGKADTARLDWMESNESIGFERWSTGWGFNDHSFTTLRDAIDSEIKPEQKDAKV
jgi:hypothetical protein